MDSNRQRIVIHSCCPGKTNIQAPEFEHKYTYNLPYAALEEWVCKGCKAVIQIGDLHGAKQKEVKDVV